MRKNNIRKTKTDKVDTYIIAKTLMMQDSYRFVTFYDLDLIDLKLPGHFRQKAIKQRTRMSKRGSRVLRYALINAAHNVVKNSATFKAYYDKKMTEGRTHYNALGHCAGKLVRVIWKMLTDEVEFNLD